MNEIIYMNLVRQRGTPQSTQGVFTIEGSAFRCLALEACDPSCSRTKNKAVLALPEGRYPLKLCCLQMQFGLRFSQPGTYRHACFEVGTEPSEVSAGSVILGTSFDGKNKISGSKEAIAALSRFLQQQVFQDSISVKRPSTMILTISKSPDFTFDRTPEPSVETLDLNDEVWDMIDDEEPEVELI